jgi:hypothetical protein
MYNGAPLTPQLGEFDPNNAAIINALSGAQPQFSGQNPQTQALLSAISGQTPSQPQPQAGGWPVLDAMSGYGDMEPTPAPVGAKPWGMLTPEQGRAEVAEKLPWLSKGVEASQAQLQQARARPDEAPALSFMGMPLISAREAKESAEQELEAAQAKKAHAEAQLAGEAALPTTTPLRNAAESAFQSAGSSYASVPKFAGYIGGWLANEAGTDVHPTDNAVFRLGDAADKWAKEAFPGDPERQDEFGSKAAHLTGFMATLYGAGGVKAMTEGGPELAAKIGDAVTKASQASIAAGTGGMGQFEGATAAMEAGKEQHPLAGVTITPQGLPVSERDRAMATLLGAGVGLTSLIPMASTLATAGERESGAILAEALKGSTLNAGQMAAFNVLNNAIAREYYDPNRPLTQGMNEDIGLGAIAGGATHAIGAATGPKRLSTPEEVKAFIDAAQRSDPDPTRAAYWRGMHEMADKKLAQLPAPGEPAAKPEAPAPDEPTPEPTNLADVGPYALRGRTDWREEAHARDAQPRGEVPPEGEKLPGDGGEGEYGKGQAVAAGESAAPREDRPAYYGRPELLTGPVTFDLKDKNGKPLVGVAYPDPGGDPEAGTHPTRVWVYPEGTKIGPKDDPRAVAGAPMTSLTMEQRPDAGNRWEVKMIKTNSSAQERGIMNSLYDAIEGNLGIKMHPSGWLYPGGYANWLKRNPELVKHHQEFEGDFLSPRRIKQEIDDFQNIIDSLDPVSDWEQIHDLQKEQKALKEAWDKTPEEAKTPEALKAQLALRGTLSSTHGGDPMYALRGFYRPDLAAAYKFPQDKATGGQWTAGLTKIPGVKRWLDLIGFDDWAKQQKGSISKDDVLTFMRMHDFNVTERHLGEGSAEHEDITEKLDAIKRELAQSPTDARRWELQERHMDLREKLKEVKSKFEEYGIPGGENYREMLIEIPELKREGWVSPHFRGQDVIHLRADDRTLPNGDLVFFLHELQSDLHQKGRKAGYAPKIDDIMAQKTEEYEKAHAEWEKRQEEWKPQERKLIRAMDSVSGKLYRDGRWLDLANKRDFAVLDPSSIHDVKWMFQRGDTLAPAYKPYLDVLKSLITPEEFKAYSDLAAKENEHHNHYEPMPPDREDIIADLEETPPEAPFKGNWWSELGAKYLVQRAVADGYDAFALPRAEQIEPRVRAKPGSLSKFYDENLPKFIEKYVKTLGGKVESVPSEDLGLHSEPKSFVRDYLRELINDPNSDLTTREEMAVTMSIQALPRTSIEDTIAGLPEKIREKASEEIKKRSVPKTNLIVRITNEMANKVLTEGQAMAMAPERVMRMAEVALKSGKSVVIPEAARTEVHDSIAPIQHIVPGDVGVHTLARIEPRQDGRLTAIFRDVSGNDLRLTAGDLSDLTNLRGFCLNDGANICIPNFAASRRAAQPGPSGAAEVRTPDAHGGVFLHEAVHSLLRRGLIPADDWSRFVSHANSLQVLDMPMHEYLGAIGEEVKPGPDTLRDNYKIAYQNYTKEDVRALLDEEEPVAHMMELFHHGHFKGDQMQPIADLLGKFVSGKYAKEGAAPAGPGQESQSMEDIQKELEQSVKGIYASDFPDKDAEDWDTHGWWALGSGKSTYGDPDVLQRVRERHPEIVKRYRDAYKASRESRLNSILEEPEE